MEENSLTARCVITVRHRNLILILSGKYKRLARKSTVLSFWCSYANFAVFQMSIKMDVDKAKVAFTNPDKDLKAKMVFTAQMGTFRMKTCQLRFYVSPRHQCRHNKISKSEGQKNKDKKNLKGLTNGVY